MKIKSTKTNSYSLPPFVNDALCVPFKYCNLYQSCKVLSCNSYYWNEGLIVVEMCHFGLTTQDGNKTHLLNDESGSAFPELWMPCLTCNEMFVALMCWCFSGDLKQHSCCHSERRGHFLEGFFLICLIWVSCRRRVMFGVSNQRVRACSLFINLFGRMV